MPPPRPPGSRRRAIIDIGSNSIRLIIYLADRRVPTSLVNEKVSARLGRTLQADGRLPERAMKTALRGLARFKAIIDAAGVEVTEAVATAAVRDAANGADFLDRVRRFGLSPTLLSGSEEASAAANGVLCAFPEADGIVADLGGGSLELIEVGNGQVGRGVTLPLGTLRLAGMREGGTDRGLRRMRAIIAAGAPGGWGATRPLYVVGGSWRALAQFAIAERRWPIRTPHGFTLDPVLVRHLVSVLSHASPASIKAAGVSGSRVSSLPHAAVVLNALVRHLRPSRVIVSTFGLREGLAFAAMPPDLRARDPFIAQLQDQFGPAAGDWIYGEPLRRWGGQAFADHDLFGPRLQQAASLLGLAARQPETAVRRARTLELTLHEKWIGVEASERAQIAAALLAFLGDADPPPELLRLCAAEQLGAAARWGCIMRLGEKLSGGLAALLETTELRISGGRLELALAGGDAIYGEAAEQQHASAASALGLSPTVTRL